MVESPDGPIDQPWCVYLPGYGREQITDISAASPDLQPIAELQFRGALWLQRNGREWSPLALLGAESGIDLDIARDNATRAALQRALNLLMDESVDKLRAQGQLNAQFFNELLTPDPERLLLLWIDDPVGTKASSDATTWSAFMDTCRRTYGFDPEVDGVITAALHLGERKGDWAKVWSRFVDAPERYPVVPDRLRAAQPHSLLPEPQDSWPVVNEQGEKSLEDALSQLSSATATEAEATLKKLEVAHAWRRETVWAKLGRTPLAQALVNLLQLADSCHQPLGGKTPSDIARAYADGGWQTDRAAISALSEAPPGPASAAIGVAVRAIYEPWLDEAARALQNAVAAGLPGFSSEQYQPGSCLLFVDGLRLDVAHMVREALQDVASCTLDWRFSTIPTLTPTAKPAVTPVASAFRGGPGFAPSLKEDGAALGISGLRKTLVANGWQVLNEGNWGDPTGRAWIEGGDIDTLGHNLPAKLPHRLKGEATQIAELVTDLLGWGWRRVIVLTDHGWLLLPGGLPKVELPIHVTEARKGRCARIPAEAKVNQLTLPWRWDPAVRIALAPGIACYEAGKEYEHGGLSPQEYVIPHLVIEAKQLDIRVAFATIQSVQWHGLRCRIQTEGAEGQLADIRTKPADAASSVVTEPRTIENGKCALVVPDDQFEGQTAAIVIIDEAGSILAQRHTTIAGE
jgi:hypothetical protein